MQIPNAGAFIPSTSVVADLTRLFDTFGKQAQQRRQAELGQIQANTDATRSNTAYAGDRSAQGWTGLANEAARTTENARQFDATLPIHQDQAAQGWDRNSIQRESMAQSADEFSKRFGLDELRLSMQGVQDAANNAFRNRGLDLQESGMQQQSMQNAAENALRNRGYDIQQQGQDQQSSAVQGRLGIDLLQNSMMQPDDQRTALYLELLKKHAPEAYAFFKAQNEAANNSAQGIAKRVQEMENKKKGLKPDGTPDDSNTYGGAIKSGTGSALLKLFPPALMLQNLGNSVDQAKSFFNTPLPSFEPTPADVPRSAPPSPNQLPARSPADDLFAGSDALFGGVIEPYLQSKAETRKRRADAWQQLTGKTNKKEDK